MTWIKSRKNKRLFRALPPYPSTPYPLDLGVYESMQGLPLSSLPLRVSVPETG